MDSGPSSHHLGRKIGDSSSREYHHNSFEAMSLEKRTAAIDSLYEALHRSASKCEIEKHLEISQGDLNFAYSMLSGNKDPEPSQPMEESILDQEKKAEDDKVLNSISSSPVRADIAELVAALPNHSASHILNMYRNSRDIEETASRLLDNYIIPVDPVDEGKGKGRETPELIAIKSEPSSSNPFQDISPHRGTSTDSDDQPTSTPATTPSSMDNNQPSSAPCLPLRLSTSNFGELSGDIPHVQVKTDNDGDDVPDWDVEDWDSDLDIPMTPREAGDEHFYGLPADHGAAVSDSGSIDEKVYSPLPEDQSESHSSSSSGSESDTDLMNNNIAEDKFESEDELSTAQKEAQLAAIFPRAGDQVGVELLLAEGDMEEAATKLEEEFGFGTVSEEPSEFERSISPGVGPSRPRKHESLKRRCEASTEDRRIKRSRWGEDESDPEEMVHNEEEVRGLESADKWVLKHLHSDVGIQIELDTGMHPCRIPENSLRCLPSFRSWLVANPTGVDRLMKVPGVSLETFNLAMQLSICSIGQLTASQRRSKTSELTALLDLAVFATTINLTLGLGKDEWFMTRLEGVMMKNRDALKGSHIRKAFEKFTAGHPIRILFVKASLRPYAEFHYSGEDLDKMSSSDCDTDLDEALNPAQRAAYRQSRFCYDAEIKNIAEYRSELFEEYHRAWWPRISMDLKYSNKHYCHTTTLTDPLTGECFNV